MKLKASIIMQCGSLFSRVKFMVCYDGGGSWWRRRGCKGSIDGGGKVVRGAWRWLCMVEKIMVLEYSNGDGGGLWVEIFFATLFTIFQFVFNQFVRLRKYIYI